MLLENLFKILPWETKQIKIVKEWLLQFTFVYDVIILSKNIIEVKYMLASKSMKKHLQNTKFITNHNINNNNKINK